MMEIIVAPAPELELDGREFRHEAEVCPTVPCSQPSAGPPDAGC